MSDDRYDYPGARTPDRQRWVASSGVRIRVHEWGHPDAPAVLFAHGGFDFARTFDVFAPMIADGGWRAVAWDHRGHGDSDHAALYSWEADTRDALAVLDDTSPRAGVPVIGHSKGGSMMLQIAEVLPHRISKLVNIDGLPSPRRPPDVEGHEQTKMMEAEVGAWLERRRAIGTTQRRPGTVEELATRRGNMNPRLSHEWLCYLVTVGARRDPDGWRWKIDPALHFGGFGPWRHAWALGALPSLGIPLLGMLGLEEERMGWGTRPEQLEPYLPAGAELHAFADTGHFVHIERPREVADLVLRFLAS